MAEKPVASDPVALTWRRWDEASRGEFDLVIGGAEYAPDAVLDTAGYGMGTFAGRDAIRGFLSEWINSFDDLKMRADEMLGIGDTIVLIVYHQEGRPLGGTNYVRVRSAIVEEWEDGMLARSTIYTEAEIDEARAAAERLAEERA